MATYIMGGYYAIDSKSGQVSKHIQRSRMELVGTSALHISDWPMNMRYTGETTKNSYHQDCYIFATRDRNRRIAVPYTEWQRARDKAGSAATIPDIDPSYAQQSAIVQVPEVPLLATEQLAGSVSIYVHLVKAFNPTFFGRSDAEQDTTIAYVTAGWPAPTFSRTVGTIMQWYEWKLPIGPGNTSDQAYILLHNGMREIKRRLMLNGLSADEIMVSVAMPDGSRLTTSYDSAEKLRTYEQEDRAA